MTSHSTGPGPGEGPGQQHGDRVGPGLTDTVDELVRVAGLVADAARHETLSAFRKPVFVEDKDGSGAGFDPVTVADRAAEAAMRTVLRQHRPDDTVRGEELQDHTGDSGLEWVLDPIDGTRAYISGLPTWGTLVAVADADGPFVGIIDQAHTDERFLGVRRGDRREGWMEHDGATTALGVRTGMDLAHATLFTTFPEVGTSDERAAFERVRDQVRLTRYGVDCYAYAMLAAGHVDLVIEAGLSAHDVGALVPVVEGAGGIASAWDGGSGHGGGRFLAAATPALHAAAMALLAG